MHSSFANKRNAAQSLTIQSLKPNSSDISHTTTSTPKHVRLPKKPSDLSSHPIFRRDRGPSFLPIQTYQTSTPSKARWGHELGAPSPSPHKEFIQFRSIRSEGDRLFPIHCYTSTTNCRSLTYTQHSPSSFPPNTIVNPTDI